MHTSKIEPSAMERGHYRVHLDGATVGRLHVLIPDLWPEADREAFFNPERGEALDDLVERRTGVRPVHNPNRIWAIIHSMPEEAHTWDDATKAAYLEDHETRPVPLWLQREGSCG
jgi:hypothetical protein